jgi:hypothetical protein
MVESAHRSAPELRLPSHFHLVLLRGNAGLERARSAIERVNDSVIERGFHSRETRLRALPELVGLTARGKFPSQLLHERFRRSSIPSLAPTLCSALSTNPDLAYPVQLDKDKTGVSCSPYLGERRYGEEEDRPG